MRVRQTSSRRLLVASLLLPLLLPSLAVAGEEVQLVVTGASLWSGPGEAVLEGRFVAIDRGRIVAVGSAGQAPPAKAVVDAGGRLVTAGFWNCHVHFIEPIWSGASRADPEQLRRFLERMLTRYGFTSVLDTGSNPADTEALSYRLERGRVPGPRLLMAGGSFVPADGQPDYVDMPLPELFTAADAEQKLQWVLSRDVAAVKIFSGSFIGPGTAAVMPLEVVAAVTGAAHAEGIPVIAHPQDMDGVRNAVYGGVDILAHTAPNGGPWPRTLVADMVERDVALVPTLQLWRHVFTDAGVPVGLARQFQRVAQDQLTAFAAAGGAVLFGTDVGFMQEYDPSVEYRLLSDAGLDSNAVLAALTTAPSARLGEEDESGRVAVGQRGDLVVLAGDPRRDIAGFAEVHTTIKEGVVIYRAEGGE